MIRKRKKNFQIGEEIPIYCRRCGLNLWGNVTAIQEGKVVQVTCRTCFTVQKYRPEIPEEELRKRKLRRAMAIRDKRASRQAEEQKAATTQYSYSEVHRRWLEKTENVDSTRARMYNQTASYREGEYILHKEYGLGYIEQVLHEQAILVLFRQKEMPLAMNMKQ